MDKLILYDKSKEKWIFFINDSNQLCYFKNGTEQILITDVYPYFDIATDENGNFHLVTQTLEGNLIYLTYDFENWKKFIVLSSKTKENTMTDFKVFIIEGRIHCFYVLHTNDKDMIIHHIFSDGSKYATPKVIDYGKSFSCAFSKSNGLHIFYFDESEKLRYKIYSNGNYTESAQSLEDNIKSIYPICDESGALHLLYVAKMTSFYTLIYFSGERKIISFGESAPNRFCFYTQGKKICIQWQEGIKSYSCESDDNGNSFKKPIQIQVTKSKRANPARVRAPFNPLGLCHDICIAPSYENEFDLNFEDVFEIKQKQKLKNEKTYYNIKEVDFQNSIKSMSYKIAENEMEISRLRSQLRDITAKISVLEKGVNQIEAPNTEENKENIDTFKNTDIENYNFENSKIFD